MALYCASQGVPFDLAFQLDEETLTAYSIILGEHASGGRFDFSRWEMVYPEGPR